MLHDTIIAVIALLSMIVFIAVVPLFVPDLDLIAVMALVSVMAAYDFWLLVKKRDEK